MRSVEYRTFPCVDCPWRCDSDLSLFTDDDFAKLRAANAGIIRTVYDPAAVDDLLSAPGMACHQDQPDTDHPLRSCAGWLAVVGAHHLATRMRIAAGALPVSAVEAGDDWPPLYQDPDEMLRHRPNSGPRSQVSQ